MISNALKIFKEDHKKSNSNPFNIEIPDINDISIYTGLSSFQENMVQRDLNNNLDEIDEVIKWKNIEKEDVEAKLVALSRNLENKNDVNLFLYITVFAIIIPQLVLSIYPILKNFVCLKYVFAIYSIATFIVSMIAMLLYVYKLLKSSRLDNRKNI